MQLIQPVHTLLIRWICRLRRTSCTCRDHWVRWHCWVAQRPDLAQLFDFAGFAYNCFYNALQLRFAWWKKLARLDAMFNMKLSIAFQLLTSPFHEQNSTWQGRTSSHEVPDLPCTTIQIQFFSQSVEKACSHNVSHWSWNNTEQQKLLNMWNQGVVTIPLEIGGFWWVSLDEETNTKLLWIKKIVQYPIGHIKGFMWMQRMVVTSQNIGPIPFPNQVHDLMPCHMRILIFVTQPFYRGWSTNMCFHSSAG